MAKVRLHIVLPPDWRDELREVAKVQGLSVSDVCRMAIRSFLKGRYS